MNWKKKTYRLIGLSLMLAALGSCGSDNKVEVTTTEDVSTSTATVDGVSSCVTVSSFTDFQSNIAAGNFMTQNYNYEQYTYRECEIDDKWYGTLTKCNDTFTRTSNVELDNISHDLASTRTELLSELTNLVYDTTNFQWRSSSSFYFSTSSGNVIAIDLCQPLAANPVYYSDDDNAYEIMNKSGY